MKDSMTDMSNKSSSHSENEIELQELAIEEMKLLLAGVRTSLSSLRAGILLLTLPLSVIGLLIITSQHHNILRISPLSEIIFSVSGIVLLSGLYFILDSLGRIRRYHRQIRRLEKKLTPLG
jgi:hypothetical protein